MKRLPPTTLLAKVDEQLLQNQKELATVQEGNAKESPHRETDPPDQTSG